MGKQHPVPTKKQENEARRRTGVPSDVEQVVMGPSADVRVRAVRYYLASGLLPPPRRAKANRFLYDERHVEVIRLIRLLQDRRSLSLETIGKMLPDLLPDLTGDGERNVFRPEMWGQLLAVHFPTKVSPSPTERLRE